MKKLLVLAIDAASPVLLREWAGDGTMPNLARLMATGLVGNTESPEGQYLGSPWPSFYTALGAGRHGFSWPERLEVGSYRMRPSLSSDFTRDKTVWEILSDAGRQVLVLDVPLHSGSTRLLGAQVREWHVHDDMFGFQTSPPRLKRSITRAVGRHPAPAHCDVPHRTVAQYRAFAKQLIRGAAARATLTNHLLATEPWEFAMQVFSEAHCAGHQLWHFHDPTNPAFDAGVTRETGDLLRDVYRAIDSAIGAVVGQCDPETSIVILTLHDMANNAGYNLLLSDILRRLGVMSPPVSPEDPASRARSGAMTRALKAVWRLVPAGLRGRLYDLRTDARKRWGDPGRTIAIDPAHTKCFKLPLHPMVGGIRLNLRGREPQGTLAPGKEADDFCAQLTRDLLELVDPESGRRLVTRVLRTADEFPGPRLDELPDLLVEWNLDQPVGNTVTGNGAGARAAAYSERVGRVERMNTYGRTGEHRIGGMFVIRSPGIAPGNFDGVVANIDLSPTFAHFLGVEMPAVDGQVVPGLLQAGIRLAATEVPAEDAAQ